MPTSIVHIGIDVHSNLKPDLRSMFAIIIADLGFIFPESWFKGGYGGESESRPGRKHLRAPGWTRVEQWESESDQKERHLEIGPRMALPTISVNQSLYCLQYIRISLSLSVSLSLSLSLSLCVADDE